MNQIKRSPVTSLGYNFIPAANLPAGKDEYYLRNEQNKNGINYRGLTAFEIEVLVRNRNTSDNWNNLLVSNAFSPEQVHNCKFFGLVRIGKLEPYYLEFKNLRRPVGLYNSTIISCDFGDNVVVDNVNYISHYIIGNDVIIVNVNELATTDSAKFGNGAIKDGEDEKLRIWLEICNENGGRKIIPFDGMLPGDAYLWSRSRDDEEMQAKFRQFTLDRFDKRRGYYGTIGDRTVIKNCKIIKDVNIGTDAYLKGANKLKNLTINSSAEATSQIGEGCEMVNGIIDYGCRIFYGVKAVRFFMASHSQLKYGARLINSYLGNNSTISCCEVLNSLIFPFHEQHHNNSFLCAALLHGQTNIAAGATIGSNHNSRSPDGELIAGRGFWPGLCVSLKHNCRFASYTILAKGDFPAEMNIRVPFSLVSNDIANDRLVVMPGYWFMFNMYALARNAWKYTDRDKRTVKVQNIEHDFLAPDSVNEMLAALEIFELAVGEAWIQSQNKSTGGVAGGGNAVKMSSVNDSNTGTRRASGATGVTRRDTAFASQESDPVVAQRDAKKIGAQLLRTDPAAVDAMEICVGGFEQGRRKTVLVKVAACYQIFTDLIEYHAAMLLVDAIESRELVKKIELILRGSGKPQVWKNIGGQLVRADVIAAVQHDVRTGAVDSWEAIHDVYRREGKTYLHDKLEHAWAAVRELNLILERPVADRETIKSMILKSVTTKEWMVRRIFASRAKDYDNPFRSMVYDSPAEMESVVGKLADNPFLLQEEQALKDYRERVSRALDMIS